jgi:hypothetical protein
LGFVGTKPTVSSNVVIADAGTIGSASDEDAIAIAADGSVTFTQDIELGHASDTTIARASAGQITVEGTAVLLAGAQTGITTILNASTKIGRDSDNLIDFATTDNKLIFRVEGVNEVELVQNALSPVTSDGVALGTGSLMWSDLFLASASVINFNNGDVSVTHTANLLTITGGGLVVGVDDTGHDVKFFGASAGAYMEWDESADQLRIMGASADATTSTGKLLLATSLTDINANDVLGKVEFQAPHEAGGTDAITVAAAIEAVAQGTFSASVNATDILFKTGHSEAATEKFRFTSQGEIGIGGTNYGSDGQVLTSGGAGAAAAWEDAASPAGSFTATADGAISAGDLVGIGTDGKVKTTGATTSELNDMCTNSIPDTEAGLLDTNGNSRGLVFAYDPDNSKGMIAWIEQETTFDVVAAVITLNTTTGAITIGSASIIHNGSSTEKPNYSMGYPALAYDTTADRFFLSYWLFHSSGSSYRSLRGIVLDINSTSVVAGTEQVIHANTTGGWDGKYGGATFMTGRGHTALFYNRTSYDGDGGSLDSGTRGRWISVLTLDNSDNSFDVESATRVSTTTSGIIAGAWDSDTGRFLVVGLNGSDDLAYQVVEHDNSDDSLTAGSETAWNTDAQGTTAFSVYYWASAQKMAATFSVGASQDTGSTNNYTFLQLIAVASSGQTATVSSNRTTLRTERQNHDNFPVDVYEPTSGTLDDKLVVTYTDYSGNTGWADVYTYVSSGVTVSVDVDAESISTDVLETDGMTIVSNGKGVSLIYFENGDTSQIEYITPSFTATTATTDASHPGRWIGIANSAISDGASGTITSVGGTGTGQSSLTVGSMYAINNTTGALAEQSNFYADVDVANVGVALTASTIYITGGLANG